MDFLEAFLGFFSSLSELEELELEDSFLAAFFLGFSSSDSELEELEELLLSLAGFFFGFSSSLSELEELELEELEDSFLAALSLIHI